MDIMQFIIHNWYLVLGIVVVLSMLAWGPLTQLMHGVQHVTTAEAIRLMNHEKGVLVDVREPDEYRGGHIPNALNLPLSGLAGSLKQIDKHKARPLIICCRTSQRSARAAVALRKQGFASVQVLAGGITAWQGENLPVEK
jgi:rhodanese-related sulfurtransferase